MFLFDLIFGKKKRPAGTPAVAPAEPPPRKSWRPEAPPVGGAGSAPGTAIHHDPALIELLKADHRLLLELFGGIGQASRTGDLAGVERRLDQFRAALQDHLLKENVRLYVYLEHLLKDDPASHELMHGFRHEMDGIGRAVVRFLGKYKGIAGQPALAAGFPADLEAVGEALVGRIRREEETLYPMYGRPR